MSIRRWNHPRRGWGFAPLYGGAIGCNMVLCMWLLTRHPLNVDGALYLETAARYLEQGFAGALAVYDWPFLPIGIAWIHQCTGWGLLQVGQGITVLGCAAFTAAFLRLQQYVIRNQPPDTQLRLMAGAAGLCITHPAWTDLWSQLLRDPGYWACVSTALHASWQYRDHRRFRDAGVAFLACAGALLFRAEGWILAAAGWAAWCWRSAGVYPLRFRLMGLGMGLIGISAIGAYALWDPHPSLRVFAFVHAGRDFVQQWATQWQAKTAIITSAILNPLAYGSGGAGAFLAGGLMAYAAAAAGRAFGWAWVAVWGYGLIRAYRRGALPAVWSIWAVFPRHCLAWIGGVAGLSAALAGLFLLQHRIVVDRWFLGPSMMLHVLTPWILESIYQSWSPRMQAAAKWIAGAWMALLGIMALHLFGPDKRYLLEAADWINPQPMAAIWVGDKQLAFHVHVPAPYVWLTDQALGNPADWIGVLCTRPPHWQSRTALPMWGDCRLVPWRDVPTIAPQAWGIFKVPRHHPQWLQDLDPPGNAQAGASPVWKGFANRRGDRIQIRIPASTNSM